MHTAAQEERGLWTLFDPVSQVELQLKLLNVLHPAARRLRGIGLGRLVDAAKRRAFRHASRFTVEVAGVQVSGATVNQLDQVRGLRDGIRDAYMTEVFNRTIGSGMLVVDVGAYIGYFTLLAARRAGSRGAVFSFEPHPANFELLRRNIAQNGFSDRVTPVQKALGAANGTRALVSRRANPSESGFRPYEDKSDEILVDCVTGDAFLAGRTVDVVKLDVEGSEIEVLLGMRQLLRAARAPTLFVECNPTALRAADADPKTLLELLREWGFAPHVIDERTRSLVPATADLAKSIEPGAYVDLFCPREPAPAI